MYTQWAPKGESYTMIVLGVGGTNYIFAKYCHIKAIHFAVPAPPELAIRENEQNTQEPTVQYWCLGLQLIKFAVKPSAFNSNSPHSFRHAASDWERDMSRLPFLHRHCKKQRKENQGTIFPYLHPPSSLWLSLSKDDARTHMQARRQIPRRICHLRSD